MINITEALSLNKDIKLNNRSIKASLKSWLKKGVITTNNEYLTIEINGYRRIFLKADDIKITDKKLSKNEMLLRELEI